MWVAGFLQAWKLVLDRVAGLGALSGPWHELTVDDANRLRAWMPSHQGHTVPPQELLLQQMITAELDVSLEVLRLRTQWMLLLKNLHTVFMGSKRKRRIADIRSMLQCQTRQVSNIRVSVNVAGKLEILKKGCGRLQKTKLLKRRLR